MTTKTISPELRAFLQDWLDWVERGAPEGEPYGRSYGLCLNARYEWGYALSSELERLFAAQGLNAATPFGSGYFARAVGKTQHECPKRLEWVRKTLAEAASEED